MATLSQINAKIGAYKGKIDECEIRKENAEEDYEKLREFKIKVQNSQSAFESSNNKKIKALEKVRSISKYNNIAKQYYLSMQDSLTYTGSRLIGSVYSFLLRKINDELQQISRKIEEYQDGVDSYNKRIKYYEKEYEKEKEKLEEEA